MPYPTGPDGGPQLLLAQSNLAELPATGWLPPSGLLQFYRPAHFWYDAQDTRVLSLDPEPAAANVWQDFSFLPAWHYDKSPIDCAHRLSFERVKDYGNFEDECRGFNFNGLSGYDYAGTLPKDQQEVFFRFFAGEGHKLGGYLTFTQGDPRRCHPKPEPDVQLLQMAIDEHIMFGDSGVAYFFISPEARADREFDKAYFYWDCC